MIWRRPGVLWASCRQSVKLLQSVNCWLADCVGNGRFIIWRHADPHGRHGPGVWWMVQEMISGRVCCRCPGRQGMGPECVSRFCGLAGPVQVMLQARVVATAVLLKLSIRIMSGRFLDSIQWPVPGCWQTDSCKRGVHQRRPDVKLVVAASQIHVSGLTCCCHW